MEVESRNFEIERGRQRIELNVRKITSETPSSSLMLMSQNTFSTHHQHVETGQKSRSAYRIESMIHLPREKRLSREELEVEVEE